AAARPGREGAADQGVQAEARRGAQEAVPGGPPRRGHPRRPRRAQGSQRRPRAGGQVMNRQRRKYEVRSTKYETGFRFILYFVFRTSYFVLPLLAGCNRTQ